MQNYSVNASGSFKIEDSCSGLSISSTRAIPSTATITVEVKDDNGANHTCYRNEPILDLAVSRVLGDSGFVINNDDGALMTVPISLDGSFKMNSDMYAQVTIANAGGSILEFTTIDAQPSVDGLTLFHVKNVQKTEGQTEKTIDLNNVDHLIIPQDSVEKIEFFSYKSPTDKTVITTTMNLDLLKLHCLATSGDLLKVETLGNTFGFTPDLMLPVTGYFSCRLISPDTDLYVLRTYGRFYPELK